MAATSTLARAALALTMLFVALAAAARACSYNGAPLLEFVLPPAGCAIPCWKHLDSPSPEIQWRYGYFFSWSVEVIIKGYGTDKDGFRRELSWNNKDDLDAKVGLATFSTYFERLSISESDVVVESYTIRSMDIPFGDLWAVLGPPAWVVQHRGDHAMLVEAMFPDPHLVAQVDVRCDGRPRDIWRTPATLIWYAQPPSPPLGAMVPRQTPLGRCGDV